MSCAGCDDCPQDAWHLHVTVEPLVTNPFFGPNEGPEILRLIGAKAVQVTNLMPDRNYKELIPTLNFQGTEAQATRALFDLGMNLIRVGFDVKRLKIEGDARLVPEGRALYYECHLKSPTAPGPVSMNAKGARIVTIRRPTLKKVQGALYAMGFTTEDYRVEACVLDTAPEIDEEWLQPMSGPTGGGGGSAPVSH